MTKYTLIYLSYTAEEIDGSEEAKKIKNKAQKTIHSFTLALNALVP